MESRIQSFSIPTEPGEFSIRVPGESTFLSVTASSSGILHLHVLVPVGKESPQVLWGFAWVTDKIDQHWAIVFRGSYLIDGRILHLFQNP